MTAYKIEKCKEEISILIYFVSLFEYILGTLNTVYFVLTPPTKRNENHINWPMH